MSEESNSHNLLNANDEQLVSAEQSMVEVTDNGKTLFVTEEIADVSVESILAHLMQYANIGDALSHVEKRIEYLVQIPLKHKEAFEAGELIINENSRTGVMWPTLYKEMENGKRQFVDNLPIKREEIVQGNPFQSIAQSYHNLYMQQQINELAEIMNRTYRVVERIEQGQKDDRIGLLLAGRDQILLSLNLAETDRDRAIHLGRSQIIEAQKQLLQTFKRRVSDFEPIPDSAWGRFFLELKHSGTLRERDKEFGEIQDYYSLYLQATHLLAASYAICGNVKEAEKVFEIAEQDMADVCFESLKTLRYIHKKNSNMFYYHAVDFVSAEKAVCLEKAKDYDFIAFKVSGEKLLEAYNHGKQQAL